MDKVLNKAKKILEKHFCFTKEQEEDILKRGGDVMSADDIKYLLSLDVSKLKSTSFEYSQFEELLSFLKKAKEDGFNYVLVPNFASRLTPSMEKSLSSQGFYLEWDQYEIIIIAFDEESYIKMKILDFQHFLGSLKSIAPMLKSFIK